MKKQETEIGCSRYMGEAVAIGTEAVMVVRGVEVIILMGDVPLLGVFADDTNFLAGSVWYHGARIVPTYRYLCVSTFYFRASYLLVHKYIRENSGERRQRQTETSTPLSTYVVRIYPVVGVQECTNRSHYIEKDHYNIRGGLASSDRKQLYSDADTTKKN
eukprot:scaffold286_cov125-Skeletonema_dohrnii-CCMP3373.AAC.5